MEKTKKFILIFIGILILGLLVAVIWKGLIKKPESSTTQTPNTTVTNQDMIDQSLVTEKTYNENDNYTTLDVKYPQFKNASGYFNKKVEDFVVKATTEHQKTSQENWQARVDTAPTDFSALPTEEQKMSFYAKYELVQANNKTISFLVRYGGFDGGAHGYENLQTFNYDVTTQSDITLASLFNNDKNYLTKISKYVRADLERQLRIRANISTPDDETNFKEYTVPMINDGTTPVLDNFSTFVIDPTTVTFYFGQYQVAPYSYGESKVSMPLNK